MIKIYQMGGSCCQQRLEVKDGEVFFIKEISKDVSGCDNGYKKFYYEVQHMLKYKDSEKYPRIFEIEDTPDFYSVTMEYCYRGCTLADLLRNEDLPMEAFHKSFITIMTDMIKGMYNVHYNVRPIDDYLEECYFRRVEKRIKQLFLDNMIEKYKFSNKLPTIIKHGCVINGEYYPPLQLYLDYIRKNKTIQELLSIEFCTHAHYDFCTLNILTDYDLENEVLRDYKLIDVRGEGDTGENKRHYIYDMGKMLLSIDCFDAFRIFNGKMEKSCYEVQFKRKDDILEIEFFFLPGIIERYRKAQAIFWEFFEINEYFYDDLLDTKNRLKSKFLFSMAMMYHPDIPCRILYEQDEEMALLFYMRGCMLIRHFLEYTLGCDPISKSNNLVELWPIKNVK